MSALARAALAEVRSEHRHWRACCDQVWEVRSALKREMALSPFGSPSEKAKALAEMLERVEGAKRRAWLEWQSARRVAGLARATS
jgi:hypothetical protein